MQIETLKIFCDVIETQSFSKAAMLNYISQSAVSQQIRGLEEKYDRRLIERGKRNLAPTQAGKMLYEGAKEILDLQGIVRRIPVSDFVVKYAVRLARSTRPAEGNGLKFIADYVGWGAGPRASQYLILGAKTRAALLGRYTPSCDDVRAVAEAVLRHRIVANFSAEADGVDTVDIIRQLIEAVPEEDK